MYRPENSSGSKRTPLPNLLSQRVTFFFFFTFVELNERSARLLSCQRLDLIRDNIRGDKKTRLVVSCVAAATTTGAVLPPGEVSLELYTQKRTVDDDDDDGG